MFRLNHDYHPSVANRMLLIIFALLGISRSSVLSDDSKKEKYDDMCIINRDDMWLQPSVRTFQYCRYSHNTEP